MEKYNGFNENLLQTAVAYQSYLCDELFNAFCKILDITNVSRVKNLDEKRIFLRNIISEIVNHSQYNYEDGTLEVSDLEGLDEAIEFFKKLMKQ